ncbi:hypothetical protein GQX73_g1896 [Xylaria multiplex]|uniref:Uncharacterized protein n=1 Tax=Xylaria multiplex TaxID=323545 RepID=A0A7C8IV58_9PEZI|nr:hypothetical protein GQX73_g1896 [Xylaria multiplex]
MFGLFKAAILLAPVAELVLALAVPTADVIPSGSLITLQLHQNVNNSVLQQTALDLRIFESTTPCGYGNVSINGEPFVQDNLGLGSGPITTDSGSVLLANWKFTCVHLEQDSQVQLLSVHIVSVDGQDVDDVAFSVQFQQIAPISISYVDGATVMQILSLTSDSLDNSQPSLEDELAELETLKEQLLALESSIALKVTHISNTFNLDRPEELLRLSECGGLKCLFNAIYNRMKSTASKLYHGGQKEPGALAHLPSWPSSHGDQYPLVNIDGERQSDNIASLHEQGRVGSHNEADGLISIASQGTIHPQQHNQSFFSGPHQIQHILILVVVVLAILVNLGIIVLIFQCVRLLRQRRQARWEKRRQRLRESRAACNALVAAKYMNLIQWIRDGLGTESLEDQEKDAIMRRMHKSDSDEESSDTLSISLEEEIAQFRAAAGVVGNLVAAEEGRGRDRLSGHFTLTRPRRASTPSSISTCPTYRSVDESLPAYDDNCSPEYVADGYQYTPDSSVPGGLSPRGSISESSTTRSSLDEDVDKRN